MTKSIQKNIIQWYQQHGRHDLPWQKNQTPYRVWVSEIMLQQTQVKTVIPYYQRFMRTFPNVKCLANAELDDVLSLWSGLGYYARARNLHKTAQCIQQDYRGRFPTSVEALRALPGIGQSTAGAILSFSKNIPAVILDGNVKRILARMYRIDSPTNKTQTLKKLWQLAEELTPKTDIKAYNQAVMDIGATVCTRSQPQCHRCPINTDCQAYHYDEQVMYPVKKYKQKSRPHKTKHMLIIRDPEQSILLQKRPATGIWGGLWSLPESDQQQTLIDQWQIKTNTTFDHVTMLEQIEHTFSHYDLTIKPLLIETHILADSLVNEKTIFYNTQSNLAIGLPAPIKKLLQRLKRSD